MTLILSSSPNTDGLTAACVRAAEAGLEAAGTAAREIRLTEASIGLCEQCGNGWGTCRSEHQCQVQDGFQVVHEAVLDADALVLITPVYWGEVSESMKAFLDRLRRCEALRETSGLDNMPVMLVAAAGGGGGGITSCLAQMERFVSHVKAKRHDLIGVTRWTREPMLAAIEASAMGLGS
jgi:multimeric flavodoxin WrbA